MQEDTQPGADLGQRLSALAAALAQVAAEVSELQQRQAAQTRTVQSAIAQLTSLAQGLRTVAGEEPAVPSQVAAAPPEAPVSEEPIGSTAIEQAPVPDEPVGTTCEPALPTEALPAASDQPVPPEEMLGAPEYPEPDAPE